MSWRCRRFFGGEGHCKWRGRRVLAHMPELGGGAAHQPTSMVRDANAETRRRREMRQRQLAEARAAAAGGVATATTVSASSSAPVNPAAALVGNFFTDLQATHLASLRRVTLLSRFGGRGVVSLFNCTHLASLLLHGGHRGGLHGRNAAPRRPGDATNNNHPSGRRRASAQHFWRASQCRVAVPHFTPSCALMMHMVQWVAGVGEVGEVGEGGQCQCGLRPPAAQQEEV